MGNNDKIENIDTTNIFEDFQGSELESEIVKGEEEKKRDLFYYIKAIGGFFKVVNTILIFVLLFSFLYIGIQSNKDFINRPFLDPICGIILGEGVNFEEPSCSSLGSVKDKYEEKLKKAKEEVLKDIIPLIEDLYVVDNFVNSKKVKFILEKSEERNDPLTLLKEFDRIKNEFTVIDKSQIVCSKVVIVGNGLEANCEAFSSSWDKSIPVFDDKSVGGTSISVASSFINFYDLDSTFDVVEPQRSFKSVKIVTEGNFTQKTNFTLSLEYNPANLQL